MNALINSLNLMFMLEFNVLMDFESSYVSGRSCKLAALRIDAFLLSIKGPNLSYFCRLKDSINSYGHYIELA